MADTQSKLNVAALGTRETVNKVKATLVVTAGADTTTTTAVVFDKAFVAIPEVIGVVCTDVDVIKGNIAATDVTKTGMNVKIYQVLAGDVASASYTVEVTLVGTKVA